MAYRYLVWVNGIDDASAPVDYTNRSPEKLGDLALMRCTRIRNATVFVSNDTPVLLFDNGAVLIGDLYDRNGRKVTDAAGLRCLTAQRDLRQRILDNYWGAYVLVQPGHDDTSFITVTRDPSSEIPCVHSPEGHFVTSAASIAWRLGLCQKKVDWKFIEHCLVYPHMKVSRTGHVGIKELLPGCMLTITARRTLVSSAWTPWSFCNAEHRPRNQADAAQTVRDTITMVVRTMSAVDNSILLELSGGLDSSVIGSCLTNVNARIVACNLISPLPGGDERRYAAQIANRLGVALQQGLLDFDDAGIQFALPEDSLRPSVSPIARMAARVVNKLADMEDVSSIYTGGGGDTVFCFIKSAAPALDALHADGIKAFWKAIRNLSTIHRCTVFKATKLAFKKLCVPPTPPCKAMTSLLTNQRPAPPLDVHPWFDPPEGTLPGDCERVFELAGNQLFTDVMFRADNRRVRMPLLSQPVMEACLGVPSWMWVAGGHDRSVARAAFSETLPEDILHRRSKGSFMNYTYALYCRNKKTIRRFLLDGCLCSRGLLDPDAINTFLNHQPAARDQSFTRIFDLCTIENWTRQHHQ